QIVMRVVGIEGAPTAIAALHADDPLGCALDRRPIALAVAAIERHDNDRGVVEIGIMRVLILEGPAAGADAGALLRPATDGREPLLADKPVEALPRRALRLRRAGFEQGMRDKRRVPDRREAGLAVGALWILEHEKLLHRLARGDDVGMIRRVAEAVIHHDGIGHGGGGGAAAVRAAQSLPGPGGAPRA